jgi:hypothetical protein
MFLLENNIDYDDNDMYICVSWKPLQLPQLYVSSACMECLLQVHICLCYVGVCTYAKTSACRIYT